MDDIRIAAERVFVSSMAGVKMSAEDICKVIGASRAAEDETANGKPIARTTLYKHLKHEMSSGRAMLKTKIAAKWHRAIDEGQAWAISFGLRTVLGLRDGAGVPPLVPEAGDEIRPTITVQFVKPDPRMRDEDPLPRRIEHTPHYDPAPPGQRLLPSPSERPMGDLSKKSSWMD
jgi:hypothetical protein